MDFGSHYSRAVKSLKLVPISLDFLDNARSSVEFKNPKIGHRKDDHRMRRNHLKGRDGDRITAVLAAAGYNFSLLRRWFTELLRVLLWILCRRLSQPHPA